MDTIKDGWTSDAKRYNQLVLIAIILGCVAVTLYVNLVKGIDTVYTHLYYIPIILAGIWYHRKALIVALFLGLGHISIAYLVAGYIVPDTFVRATIFFVVALVVGTLSQNRDRLLNDLRLLLESTDEGIYGVDSRDNCTFINLAALRMLGYSREEVIGQDTHDLIHHTRSDGTPCSREECCVLKSLRIGTGCRDSDDVFWRKDGASFPVEYSSYPIIVDDHVKGAVVTFVDITERKEAEREVRDARRQAEMYVDLMGHDINNMNQVGISYLELGLGDLPLDKAGRVYLEKPLEALKSSTELIDTVRKLQKIKEGGLKHEKVDLCRMLRDAVAAHSSVPGRDVTMRIEAPEACPVMADELLKDVVGNIVSNAIKHSSGPVTVDVRVRRVSEGRADCYRVDISDNGPGISDEIKKTLFRRYQRGETHVSGHGLGLYLVKKLVDGFNGKVWVEDRVPGDHTKGARFVVMIPAATS